MLFRESRIRKVFNNQEHNIIMKPLIHLDHRSPLDRLLTKMGSKDRKKRSRSPEEIAREIAIRKKIKQNRVTKRLGIVEFNIIETQKAIENIKSGKTITTPEERPRFLRALKNKEMMLIKERRILQKELG